MDYAGAVIGEFMNLNFIIEITFNTKKHSHDTYQTLDLFSAKERTLSNRLRMEVNGMERE